MTSSPSRLGGLHSLAIRGSDTIPPETTVTSSVDGNGAAVNSGGATLSNAMTFQFGGTDIGGVAGFQCELDGGGFTACTSPKTYLALAIGNHIFKVRAIDTSGNIDPTPAIFTWTRLTPAQAIQNLITTIGNMGLTNGVATSLSATLNNINTNNQSAACAKLYAFITKVGVDLKKGVLTPAQATQLLVAANAIADSLGCAP